MDDLQTHARTALEQVCARGDLDRARELYAEHFVDHVNTLEFHDLRAELTLLARWNLSSLERRSRLSRLVRRESTHFPPRSPRAALRPPRRRALRTDRRLAAGALRGRRR